MPSLGWTPAVPTSKTFKLLVFLELWNSPSLYSKVNGQKKIWSRLEEAREFAAKSGFSGIKVVSEEKF